MKDSNDMIKLMVTHAGLESLFQVNTYAEVAYRGYEEMAYDDTTKRLYNAAIVLQQDFISELTLDNGWRVRLADEDD